MKDIELLLPRVMELAPTCPEPTAIRHLRDAAIEFCRRTRIWRESDTFALDGGCEAIAVEQDCALYEITHARFDGRELLPITIDWLDKNDSGWRDRQGPPRWLTQSAPNTVRVVPAPEEAGTLELEMILTPSHDAERLPDILVETYANVLADGAAGRVLMLPAVEWTNPQLGAAHAAAFRDELGRWSDRVPRGQQRAKRRTTPSSYF